MSKDGVGVRRCLPVWSLSVQAFVPSEKPRLARWSMMPLYGYFSEPMKTRLADSLRNEDTESVLNNSLF